MGRSRINRARALLLLLGVVAVMLWAAGMWTNVVRWGGDGGADVYAIFSQLGISSMTASAIMSQFGNMASHFLTLGFTAVVGALFVSAVRWQRSHAR